VGRPVFTVMKPEFRLFQMGTPHFRYLITLAGGLLHTADGWSSHLSQLTTALDDEAGERDRLRRFVEAFVRPGGLGHSATPDFADAVERAIQEPARTQESAALVKGASPRMAAWLRDAIASPTLKPILLSAYDIEYEGVLQRRRDEEAAHKDQQARAKAAREAEFDRVRDEKLRQKADVRREKERVHRERWRQKQRQQRVTAVRTWLRRLLPGGAK
jgi:hypothetical protein